MTPTTRGWRQAYVIATLELDTPPSGPSTAGLLGALACGTLPSCPHNWVLSLDGTPLYILRPRGPHYAEIIASLARTLLLLEDRSPSYAMKRELGYVSVAGTLRAAEPGASGGRWLPVLELHDPDCLRAWTIEELVRQSVGRLRTQSGSRRGRVSMVLRELLEYGCTYLRNPGQHGRDRALNLALSQPQQLADGLARAAAEGLELDDLEVERVDDRDGVWQLSLHFCEPEREDPLWAYRFAVDVDALAPVSGAFFGRIR